MFIILSSPYCIRIHFSPVLVHPEPTHPRPVHLWTDSVVSTARSEPMVVTGFSGSRLQCVHIHDFLIS